MKIIGNMKLFSLQVLTLSLLWAGVSDPASALPSFTRQTGEACVSCHIGGFGPQLTPRGMKFKIGGYAQGSGKSVPVSATLLANYTQVAEDLPVAPEHYDENNNAAMQDFSLFLAGKLAEYVGSYSRVAYSGIDHRARLDTLDMRGAFNWGGATFGFSLNNDPTVADPMNSTPFWRFPYVSPALGGAGPGALPISERGLNGSVWGTTLYGATEDGLYGQVGFYRTFSDSMQDNLNVEADRKITNFGNIWHVAYLKDLGTQAFSFGVSGLGVDLHNESGSEDSDNYTDAIIDANYQYLGDREHILTLDFSYTKEKQNLQETYYRGGSDQEDLYLKLTKMTASYYYQQTYGFTAQMFNLSGTADAQLYAPADETGDPLNEGKPDSKGYILQADWTPLGKSSVKAGANVRVGLQYLAYSKINGATQNYDGAGRDASDDNTLSLFAWGAF